MNFSETCNSRPLNPTKDKIDDCDDSSDDYDGKFEIYHHDDATLNFISNSISCMLGL